MPKILKFVQNVAESFPVLIVPILGWVSLKIYDTWISCLFLEVENYAMQAFKPNLSQRGSILFLVAKLFEMLHKLYQNMC
jgi:hypothetical protein